MQFPVSIKEYLAVSFALLYLLSPMHEQILELSHKISHQLSETSSAHHHSHVQVKKHTHSHGQKEHSHAHQEHSPSAQHSHDVLDFIGTVLNTQDHDQIPQEKTEKEKYDKHLLQELAAAEKFVESHSAEQIVYKLKDYSNFRKIPSPPPEIFST
ncbi:hypothetical protein MKO06_05855 [Gramella sp. GC03-9]|uniref:Uncharacterized protein n=1 Tax=Christiangramia oceanisediminis TaxID=2920386 RepID=A0A9X2I1U2_9FLAO|nr:hypothetical protein [Gramella oceanisediminis]MCP9199421.1 hypothetical protein [Gramella oceanisediminis]